MAFAPLLLAARAPDAAAPEDSSVLEPALQRLWAAARAAWPDVTLGAETFMAHLGALLPLECGPVAALGSLHGSDLYLACACAHGDPKAIAAFERVFIGRIDAFLCREDALPSFTDELKQTLRARLLVADHGLLPRIGQYTGRGPLGAWLWMATTRMAVDLRRQSQDAVSSDRLAELTDRTLTPDPELGYLKARYGPQLRAVFREVLAALPPRDGALLRLHFLEGLSTEQIGTSYGVSRWTANRWLSGICQGLLKETRKRLGQVLELAPAQVESVLRLVRSEMALSVRAALDPGKPNNPHR